MTPLVRAGGTLGSMTAVIFMLSRSAVPRSGAVEVPCYVARSFDGRTAQLWSEERWVEFDFASLTDRDAELIAAERGGEWTIQGLIAVDVDWLIGVMEVATSRGKTLGVEIDAVWYYVSPANLEPVVLEGRFVVVGLFR